MWDFKWKASDKICQYEKTEEIFFCSLKKMRQFQSCKMYAQFEFPQVNGVLLAMRTSRRSLLHPSTVAGLAQSVERLTAEREVAGSIPGAGPLLRVLK